ncbi:MAG: Crp/Fnr family transcriptional regulator [Eubacteriaceae bacterium]|nr:Crp/Fnr family transcriptional regulator [Eubacteriaceae bacterium]
MKKELLQVLASNRLFAGMDEDKIEKILDQHYVSVRSYAEGERIFNETDVPKQVMMLISGSVAVAKDTVGGKRMIMAKISEAGDIFGEIYAFMELEKYDMYAEAMEDSVVFSMDTRIFKEYSDPLLVRNQALLFAEKAYQMHRRLRVLGSSGMREKIARFIIERQKKGSSRVNIMAREEMADYLGVTRPSLSRELSVMAKEGILEIKGREAVIIDQEALEEYI